MVSCTSVEPKTENPMDGEENIDKTETSVTKAAGWRANATGGVNTLDWTTLFMKGGG
jgi:hypothetical protein